VDVLALTINKNIDKKRPGQAMVSHDQVNKPIDSIMIKKEKGILIIFSYIGN